MGHHERASAAGTPPGQGAGVAVWHSLVQLGASRRRYRIAAVCLALVAALWIAALSGGTGGGVLGGFIFLEVITLTPLALTLFRLRHLTREIRQANRPGSSPWEPVTSGRWESVVPPRWEPVVPPRGEPVAPEPTVPEPSKADQPVAGIEQMVRSLDPGPLREAGDDAVREAKGIVGVRVQLAQRLAQLSGMESLLEDPAASGTVQGSADACLRQLSTIDHELDTLAASVATLMGSSGVGHVQGELAAVRDATDRVAALAGAMDELSASDPGPAAGGLPTDR